MVLNQQRWPCHIQGTIHEIGLTSAVTVAVTLDCSRAMSHKPQDELLGHDAHHDAHHEVRKYAKLNAAARCIGASGFINNGDVKVGDEFLCVNSNNAEVCNLVTNVYTDGCTVWVQYLSPTHGLQQRTLVSLREATVSCDVCWFGFDQLRTALGLCDIVEHWRTIYCKAYRNLNHLGHLDEIDDLGDSIEHRVRAMQLHAKVFQHLASVIKSTSRTKDQRCAAVRKVFKKFPGCQHRGLELAKKDTLHWLRCAQEKLKAAQTP